MSNTRAPTSSPPPASSSSFRRRTAAATGTNRIVEIWAGNEKLGTEALIEANSQGLAVMFSPTSDRGALAVHAWYGTRHWKDYVTSPDELEDVLEGLRDFKPAQPGPAPNSPLKSRVRTP